MRVATTESAVLRACLDWLTLHCVCHWRSNNTGVYDPARKRFRSFTGMKGVADILCVVNGRLVCVECKSPTGKQSDDQRAFQALIENAGGAYLLARGVGDLESNKRVLGV